MEMINEGGSTVSTAKRMEMINEGESAVSTAKRMVELEAQVERLEEHVISLKAKEENTKKKCVKLKEKLDSEDSMWRERLWKAELDKRKLEIDVAAAMRVQDDAKARLIESLISAKKETSELVEKIRVLEKEKRETEVYKHKVFLLEFLGREMEAEKAELRDEKRELAFRIAALEEENERLEEEAWKEKDKTSELVQKIRVLEKEKSEINEERISELVKYIELWDGKQELASRIDVLEREKERLEEEAWKEEEKTSELVQKIHVLEEEKRKTESYMTEINEHRVSVIIQHLNMKSKMEAEKTELRDENRELALRVDVLEKENRRLEEEARKEITEEDLIGKFSSSVSTGTSLALAISYPLVAAAPHMFFNAYKNVLAIGVATDYSVPHTDKIKEYLACPSKKDEPTDESDDDDYVEFCLISEKEPTDESEDDDFDFCLSLD